MLRIRDLNAEALPQLLRRYGVTLEQVADTAEIPGSFWGDSEAGLVGTRLIVRADTPWHSALHESSHYICMDEARRGQLHRDAGGDHAEENAVCYLQILLADYFPETNRAQLQSDMDAWGYTFRLGSAREWFERDALDAREWLQRHGVIDDAGRITWRLRI
jgi:hypothetical protein